MDQCNFDERYVLLSKSLPLLVQACKINIDFVYLHYKLPDVYLANAGDL